MQKIIVEYECLKHNPGEEEFFKNTGISKHKYLFTKLVEELSRNIIDNQLFEIKDIYDDGVRGHLNDKELLKIEMNLLTNSEITEVMKLIHDIIKNFDYSDENANIISKIEDILLKSNDEKLKTKQK